jgi:hypothetical protein
MPAQANETQRRFPVYDDAARFMLRFYLGDDGYTPLRLFNSPAKEAARDLDAMLPTEIERPFVRLASRH